MIAKPEVGTKSLYDVDYCRWLEETANSLRNKNYADVDFANLIEEIEYMARKEKSALRSNLIVVLKHLLKWQFQPERRSGSWSGSIREHRRRINEDLEDSPSLVPYLESVFAKCYDGARQQAADETGLPLQTFPFDCPYALDQSLDPDYLPR